MVCSKLDWFHPKMVFFNFFKNKFLMQDINHAFYSRYWVSVTPKVPFASGLRPSANITIGSHLLRIVLNKTSQDSLYLYDISRSIWLATWHQNCH